MTGQDRFTGQLTADPYVLSVPAGPGPPAGFSPAGPWPGTSAAPDPCALLVGRPADAELDAVASLLRRAGIRHARLCALTGLLADPGAGSVRLAGRWITPTAFWRRHAGPAAGPPGSPALELFWRESWDAAAVQLAAAPPAAVQPGAVPPGAGPGAAVTAPRPGLADQLRQAARLGIAVPRTVVTDDPAQALPLLPAARLVVKALHRHFVEAAPGRLTGIFPVTLTRDELRAQRAPGMPVVVQEYVEHDAELRVYYVHGELYGFRIGKSAPSDLWRDEARVTVAPAAVPPAAGRAARALAEVFRLYLASFDFLLRGGVPVFLELDTDGDWRWIERRGDSAPVTAAVARLICALHRGGGGSVPAAARPRDRLDLLTFLAGAGQEPAVP